MVLVKTISKAKPGHFLGIALVAVAAEIFRDPFASESQLFLVLAQVIHPLLDRVPNGAELL